MRLIGFIICLLIATSGWAQQVVDSPETTLRVISNGDALTVTQTGSIIVSDDDAIRVETADVTGNIQIDGTVETTSADDHAININVGVNGSIIINGTVKAADGDGIDVTATGRIITGSIINNGTIISDGEDSDQSGIEFDGGVIQGDIINSATGTIISNGDNGIAIWGDEDDDFTDNDGVLEGQLINHGTITAACEVFDIDNNSWIKGGIVNTGTLENTSSCAAIEIDQISRVDGGISNSGLIDSQSHGIEIEDGSLVTGGIVNNGTFLTGGPSIQVDVARVEGGIINNGLIDSQSHGIEIEVGSVVIGNIVNNGGFQTVRDGIQVDASRVEGSIINALGASITSSRHGIYIDDDGAVLEGQLINHGTITSGPSSEALDIDGGAHIESGIINTGTIKSFGAVTIEIDDDDTRVDGGLDNSGVIESEDNEAIHLENGAVLNGGLTNSGVIRSNSSGDRNAFELRDATLNGGLTNTGLIAAPTNALLFDSDATLDGDLDNQRGGVIIGLVSIETDVNMINSGQWFMKTNANFDNPTNTGSVGEMSTVTGTYTQSTGGLLGIASEASGFSQLSVDGDVTFAPNTRLHVDVKNSGLHLAVGDRLENVVQATGTLTAERFLITDNSSTFAFVAETDDQSLTLVVVAQPLAVPTMSAVGLAILALMVLLVATFMRSGLRLS